MNESVTLESPGYISPIPSTKKRSRIWHEVNAAFTIMMRDITLTIKTPGTIIMSLAMPLLMMGMIGGNLMDNMASGLGFNFGEFMLVGMLVNMLFMMTTMGMTSLIDDHETSFTQEMLITPVSRYSIVIGKILGSAFMGLVSCIGVLVVGAFMGIGLEVWQLLTLLALSPLMCLAGGALAMLIMGFIKNKKMSNIAIMLITLPQMFLSGVIIPITNSTGILFILSRIMPMTYCVDLARSVVYAGTPQYSEVVLFNPAINLVAITALTVLFLVVGTYFYARTEKNR